MGEDLGGQKIASPERIDNWPTHGMTHTCLFCASYVPKLDGAKGRCRRHAPTMSGFPVVFPDDWCGDHKLK